MIDFLKNKCPFCGGLLSGDNGSGSFEFDVFCEENQSHFRYRSNMYCDSVDALGKEFRFTY